MHAAGRQALRVASGIAIVVVVTIGLDVAGARLEIAAVALLLAVLAAGLLGYAAGLTAAVVGYLLLLYTFTPPVGSVHNIGNLTDFLVGVSYAVGAVVASLVVARLDELRRRSQRHAREAEIRLLVTERTVDGGETPALLRDVADAVIPLFGVSWCRIRTAANGNEVERGSRTRAGGRSPVEAVSHDVAIAVGGGAALDDDDRATLDSLAAALDVALDRARLAGEARRHRVDAELARSRAAFLAAVTHDLRTPLATIKAATAALMVPGSPLTEAERHELLEVANADASELDDLVTKVLDLAGIRSGPLTPRVLPTSPDDVVHAAIRRAKRDLADRTVTVTVAPDTPTVEVDLVMLEHALANLLENAVHHAPGSPIEVVVAAAPAAPAGDRVELRVVDHGPGVHADDADRIFEEFVRVGPESRRGFGLGLTIVRVLVESHHGTVQYEPTPGGGATFVISVPREFVAAPVS